MNAPRLVSVPGGSVHVRELGPPDGPVLFFVHGLFVSGTVWDPVVERLAARHRCIVPDLPMGSHRAPMDEGTDLSPAGMADVVADLLVALDLSDVVLVGNDSGGAVCQLMMTRRPARVAALVLTTCDALDVFPPSPFGPLVALARFPAALRALLWSAVKLPFLTRLPFAYGLVTKRPIATTTAASWIRPAAVDARVCADVCKFLRGFDPAVTTRAAALLTHVDVPALVLWAAEDRSFPLRLGRGLVDALPDAELVTVDDAWVFASLDAPGPVADAIAAFVRGRVAGATRRLASASGAVSLQ